MGWSALSLGWPYSSGQGALTIEPDSIASEEAFGTPTFIPDQFVSPTEIASAEAFGSPVAAGPITWPGVDSEEAFGSPAFAFEIVVTSVGSDEAFGNPVVTGPVSVPSIDPQEAFGTPLIADYLAIATPSIDSEEAFGTPVAGGPVSADGIASDEAVGTPVAAGPVSAVGIASDEAFGDAVVQTSQPIYAESIGSDEAFGTLTATGPVSVPAIASEEAFGTATFAIPVIIAPTAIDSDEAFGTPVLLSPPCFSADGRQGTGVVQPQSGTDYPLIGPPSADVQHLLADAWLSYRDPSDDDDAVAPYTLPFSVSWLFGFGDLPATAGPSVPTPAHAADAEIRDADGRVVFDSTVATYAVRDWGDRLRIHDWRTATQVLRLVEHRCWSAADTPYPQGYPSSFEPEAAALDSRTVARQPRLVRSLGALLSSFTGTQVELANGFNVTLDTRPAVPNPGKRRTNRITINAVPGSGAGVFPGCDQLQPSITQLASVRPNAAGHMLISVADCYWLRYPVQIVDGEAVPYVSLGENVVAADAAPGGRTEAALQLGNDCEPCCRCDDYVTTARYLNAVRDRYQAIGDAFAQHRDTYHANRTRWLAAAACAAANNTKIKLQSQFCPYMDVGAQFCNNSPSCLFGVTMTISFTAGMTGTLIPMTTQISSASGPARYELGGTWPNYSAYFDVVPPYSNAWVKFRLGFPTCTVPLVVSGCATSPYGTGCGATTLSCPPTLEQQQALALVPPVC